MYCSLEGNAHAVYIPKVSFGLGVVDQAESIPSSCARRTLLGCGEQSPRTFVAKPQRVLASILLAPYA